MTKAEHLALENLRKDKDHIIVTADKDVALVVMDKTEYIMHCEALLQDNSVNQHLSKDTSQTIHKELIKILQDYKRITISSLKQNTPSEDLIAPIPQQQDFIVFLKSTKAICLCAP